MSDHHDRKYLGYDDLNEDIHLLIIDFLIRDLSNSSNGRIFLLTHDIKMAIKLEMVYGRKEQPNCKFQRVVNGLNGFWRAAVKKQFNFDELWIENHQHFIEEHFKGNMKGLFSRLCHAKHTLYREETKKKRTRFSHTFSIVASVLVNHECGVISSDGCEKHKIISILEGRSTLSTSLDSEDVDSLADVQVDMFIHLKMKELKKDALKEHVNNPSNPQFPIEFKCVIGICKSDNEESLEYMINCLKYCIEMKKTYKIPCFIAYNRNEDGPQLISFDRIDQSLKDIGLSFYRICTIAPTSDSLFDSFIQESYYSDIDFEKHQDRLVEILEQSLKKKCLIQ